MEALQLVRHGSPEPVRRATIKQLEREKKTPTCISLFTGAGGAALGFSKAGFEIRAMVEFDKYACETLRANWVVRPADWRDVLKKERREYVRKLKQAPDEKRRWFIESYETPHYWWQERPPVILEGDITTLTTERILAAADLKIGEATSLEGGFPCQGFSVANNRRDVSDHTKDERNVLYKECVRVIREALPRSFMLENVPGLVSMEKGAVIRMICQDLVECGYDVTWDILNAADYGVPQNRKRVIIVGTRNDVLSEVNGRIGLHMGAAVGTIRHPEWFLARYRALFQGTLF